NLYNNNSLLSCKTGIIHYEDIEKKTLLFYKNLYQQAYILEILIIFLENNYPHYQCVPINLINFE
ncbi:hypothetical protein, partial [Flavobacterium sp. A45]|uniref:hypothetical protein n=1 Tax=Flavobacterium sp. A45 TaxID=1945862 RepID=UPI0009C8CADF